ncbi:hypothetical protein [Streptomyces sp. NBC_00328]|uniref:hypothetical protein n=1 Tax=Streptomyces sp. NBC_00328 TaxID=2903646 RepID=UPI002E2B3789|nr:hypothetical protein [Streptomyces sp. NBC_00328]
MKSRTRWTAMAAAATAAICLTGSASASSAPSPGGKPTTSPWADRARAAKERELAAAKAEDKAKALAGGKAIDPAAVKAKVLATGKTVDPAAVKAKVLATGKDHGKGKPSEEQAGLVEPFAKGLSARLGVSLGSARQAVKELFALADRHSVDPRSPEFAAIAKRLGVTPGQFDKALSATKQAAIAKEQSLKD